MENYNYELNRFVNDPKYRNKIIGKIQKQQDAQYVSYIKQLEKEKDELINKRLNELATIRKSRWKIFCGGYVLVNNTEGKVKISNYECSFNRLKDVEIIELYGSRFYSYNNTTTTTQTNSKSKSHKHFSLGGAAVGSVAGPIGTVVGGVALGKTTGKTKAKVVSRTNGSSYTNEVATCTHLGVKVNVDGNIVEIPLITSPVDLGSATYVNAMNNAQTIISSLKKISITPIPSSSIAAEEEVTIKEFDSLIEKKNSEIEIARNNKPKYYLPEIYRTDAQKNMSDKEYLDYLAQEDIKKTENPISDGAENVDYAERSGIIVVLSVVYSVFFWIVSILFMALGISFISQGAYLSGVIAILVMLLINPTLTNLYRKHNFDLPKWTAFIIPMSGLIFILISFMLFNNSTDKDGVYLEEQITTTVEC